MPGALDAEGGAEGRELSARERRENEQCGPMSGDNVSVFRSKTDD